MIDLKGNIIAEELTEEGTVVQLKAILTYEGRQQVCEFGVCVLPQILGEEEELIRSIREEAGKADGENRSEKYMILPMGRRPETEVDERPGTPGVRAPCPQDRRGMHAHCAQIGRRKKEKEKQNIRQMQIDYPQIINKFNLYIRAGMTVRKAWFRIVQDHQMRNGDKSGRKAYDEMAAAMYQIRGGLPEGECYESFGRRCGEPAYRRFGMLLSQNLRKGSGGLAELLEREASEAFEDRKKLAEETRGRGRDETDDPLFMMLVIVLIIVTVPAFFSIQI